MIDKERAARTAVANSTLFLSSIFYISEAKSPPTMSTLAISLPRVARHNPLAAVGVILAYRSSKSLANALDAALGRNR